MKSISISALPLLLLVPFTSAAVSRQEVELKLSQGLPSHSLSDLIGGQIDGPKSLSRSISFDEQQQCFEGLGYQYNATDLVEYDPFNFLMNIDDDPTFFLKCPVVMGDDERFPGAIFFHCDRYDETVQDAVEELCESQVENIDIIIWDTSTTEKVPFVVIANQPICFAPTCDRATIFFLVNIYLLGYFSDNAGLLEARFSGTGGMDCAQSLTRNYGTELALTEDGTMGTIFLGETSLTPYFPDVIFTENCKEYSDPTKKFCNQKGKFEEVRPSCEAIGGTYVEYDIKQLTTVYTAETRKSVSKFVPFCVDQKCIPEEAMAYTEFFFQQLFYDQYAFQHSVCLENKYSKFDYTDESMNIKTGTCGQMRGDKFTAEQKEELCSEHGDLCPASCGKCDEHPENKFVQSLWKGKATYKSCDWLSERSDAVIAKICGRNGFKKGFGPAFSACPDTCGVNVYDEEDEE
jgi:hypothetical protein